MLLYFCELFVVKSVHTQIYKPRMAAQGPPQGPGRGIHIAGHDNFNNRLMSRLSLAPADLMHFLEACAMGNLARVESLLERGVEVF